ncbi:type I restriction-modification system subunit M [Tenacibaculum finnmarkense]|uniref:type I restriction-modification system subunit M n=1 Tax=Tenacibaculum finnmarkense TaxID=2781243 RepID=UPI001E621DD8|nr:type I restriction-modification system subunit M [Tenacibaculum finnmarkense]MCD8402077.1 type I restriction-modification system subunit M [Tenacibaculum finnmarkense genomovar finnmarkense]
MNKQQLATKIWESANQMRSKIEANEYKDYILGFIFYKYLSEKQEQFLISKDFSEQDIQNLNEEDAETVKYIKENIGYFIAYKNLFSTWINAKKDFEVANVRDALSAFNRLIYKNHKKLFEDIFEILQTGLSKLGENASKQTKVISDLIHLINDIPMDGKQDYDVLGFIYEFLIAQFAQNAGKKAGEFYTPNEVSVLMSEIISDHLKDAKEIKIYDSCSGSGSLLINIGNSVAKYMTNKGNIKYYAQELKRNTYNLTRMNLIMRGILPDNIFTRNGDTLEEDWPFFDENEKETSYERLRVDAVVSNPPYSQNWNTENKESEARYSRFGVAPKGKADFAFLLHDLYHLKPNGIMNIVLPHGVLFRGGEEGKIRRNLIEQNHIHAIIGLPAGIFFGTGIPTVIIVLRQERTESDILFIDASKGFIKDGKNNKLRASDIKKIADTVNQRITVPKFSSVVTKDEIRNNEYNLNIPRYIDASEKTESWDIYASMFGGIPKNELDDLNHYWNAFNGLKEHLFKENTPENYHINVTDSKTSIKNHQSVQLFINQFTENFNDFDAFLNTQLINNKTELHISSEKNVISNAIFKRLKNIPLLDKYVAYEGFSNEWEKISIDLEMIHSEGSQTIKKVDPNMVVKKKSGKDVEAQQGWKGRIIPFALAQQILLEDDVKALQQNENQLQQLQSEIDELTENINTAQEAIENGAENDEELETEIFEHNKQLKTNKTSRTKLNKIIKTQTDNLHLQTKETIENLTEAQVNQLLTAKWIQPIVLFVHKMPENTLQQLNQKITALAKKYSTTYAQVANDIQKTQNSLSEMINELEGNQFDMQGLNELQNLLNHK